MELFPNILLRELLYVSISSASFRFDVYLSKFERDRLVLKEDNSIVGGTIKTRYFLRSYYIIGKVRSYTNSIGTCRQYISKARINGGQYILSCWKEYEDSWKFNLPYCEKTCNTASASNRSLR